MKPIRVLLADDHNLIRAGLRLLLENLAGIEVVAEAGDGREALRLVKMHHPDVVLMDIMMPGMNGLEAAARAAREFPDVRIVMLSVNATEEYVLQALHAGAAGYLLKNISPAELEAALRAVARGERYLASAVSKHVIEAYLQRVGLRQLARAADAEAARGIATRRGRRHHQGDRSKTRDHGEDGRNAPQPVNGFPWHFRHRGPGALRNSDGSHCRRHLKV